MQKNIFLNVKQLLKIGVYFNSKQQYNQRVLNNLFVGYRQKMAIYHYDVLIEYFLLIRVFIFNVLRRDGSILFYDDSKRFEQLMAFYAPLLNQQVLLGRWVPGTFTNYSLLQHTRLTSGVQITKIPDLIFYFNVYDNDVLLKEAFSYDIPVLSIIDANSKFLFYYTYVLPGNKQSYKFVIFIFYLISYYIFKYSKMVFQKTPKKVGNKRAERVINTYYTKALSQLKFEKLYRHRRAIKRFPNEAQQKRWAFVYKKNWSVL